ncbi:hypothetical protein ACFOZ5_00980 [Marinobacter lacisalsi]|uniref:Uncharacterized protein n=1 Tax=Marinobacter lacisalsi TaxID=475979 RepID=A0ABV8QD05_9GAMM
MTSAVSTARKNSETEEVISPSTAKNLANYGITFINSADEIILKRGATVITKISKSSAGLLGPAIALLDSKSAEGALVAQTRFNIERYYAKSQDLNGQIKMRQMLSRGDHIGIVLYLLSHGYQYKSLDELLNEGLSQ